jgi:hypothetical protein
VTFMMAKVEDGFLPLEWQDSVGNVIFVRRDMKPLDVKEMQALLDYHRKIITNFGDTGNKVMQ